MGEATLRALDIAGRAPVRATGSSMSPFLRSGSTYWIERCRPEQLRVGDVAAYRQDDFLVLHRVVGICASRIVVRGDAQPEPVTIEATELIGRLCGIALGRRQWRDAPRPLGARVGRAIVRVAPWVRLTRRALAWARAWAPAT